MQTVVWAKVRPSRATLHLLGYELLSQYNELAHLAYASPYC